ncbi:tRNA (adenosine(37)-N6)-dimethylallyltransferase MiaA [Schaalia sp. 19OD2882]|uniref:tRNA (adenosine(37)-N6)-dimethylallyltransferase MiaA n=1 Tax=Schaalia sp. 19OD2882 TaxID=2794089 RepID=UPI001C1EA8C7|nr:tRNA (adenosine(37)-N6)-dimethylallyltransferase MiaA [Schaalia sp. 19OD2882]QWW18957.1 tRNA (adenosine(37)-N6)-dimethylallyltransferase MiaA [Schaalia sp. 19OD2882]
MTDQPRPDLALARPGDLVVAVVGPTASGKSDLALDLAEALPQVLGATGPGELVSADSMQFYRGMDIGTAKTPVEERRGIAHHQIDTLEVTEEPSAARYQCEARADVAAIHRRGGVAVVAGGSGLYQRALLDVIDFPGTDPEVRARLEAEAVSVGGVQRLHARLEELDPVSAGRIDARNTRRIVRALEVISLTGRPYSSQMPRHVFHRPALMIGVDRSRQEVDQRIEVRTHAMFDQGLVEEVRALEAVGLRAGRTASKATGYAQALAVLDGEMTPDEAVDAVSLATRQLVRRQLKWLRPDPRVVWLPAAGPRQLLASAIKAVQRQVEALRCQVGTSSP